MVQTVSSKKTVFPGNLVVGAAQAAEYQQISNATGAAAATVDLTFALAGVYSEIPAIMGTPMLTPGDGSATTKIVAWYVKMQSTTEIVVTVEVDQVAGAGKDNTVTMCAYIAGPQA